MFFLKKSALCGSGFNENGRSNAFVEIEEINSAALITDMDTTVSVSSERGHQQLKKNRLWFELEEYGMLWMNTDV